VIHCAAERRVEVVDGDFDKALKINVSATEHLAKLCAEQGIYFVYISTDYVFDGKNPPYKIDSIPNPLNKYGLSKLKGEEVTQQASKRNLFYYYIT
jgi:S-adenosylmethionine synthetase